MQPNDELCLCFHITHRKVVNYIRIEKPRRPAQLSECYGAGTGCGWCRPFLKKLWEERSTSECSTSGLPAADEYARDRSKYVRTGQGTPPPGATPINEDS
jgi:bacterioferritin-associated ferredoxin